MIEVHAKTRKFGNSLGLSSPTDIVRQARIRPNKEITIFIQEKAINLSKVFGTLEMEQPTQERLDRIREGED